MMEFSGEFTVDGAPDELWKYFTDPEILQDAAPGCESMTLRSPSQLTATLAVGVGSVKPSFDVDAVVTEADRPNRLEITASGEASRNSFELSAWQELRDNGDGTTTVVWEADAEISGIIASMGERAIGSVADNLVNEFFRELESHVTEGTPAESRLLAADDDEAVGEAEAAVEEPETPAGPAADAAELAAGAVDGGRAASVGLGVGIGVAVATVWRRLAGGTDGRAGDSDAPATGGGHSLLTVLLALALGAVSALLWSRSRQEGGPPDRTAPTGTEGGDGTGDSTATADATDTTADEPQGNGAGETADRPDPATGDLLSENPIDRLESRP